MATNLKDIAFDESKNILLKRVLSGSAILTLTALDRQENGALVEYNDGTDNVRVFFPYSAIESLYQIL